MRGGLPFRCYTPAETPCKRDGGDSLFEGLEHAAAHSNAVSLRRRHKHPPRMLMSSSAGSDCPLLQTDTANSLSMSKARQKKKRSFWHCTWHTHVGMSTPLGGGRDSHSKMCEPGYRVLETLQNSMQSDDFYFGCLDPRTTFDISASWRAGRLARHPRSILLRVPPRLAITPASLISPLPTIAQPRDLSSYLWVSAFCCC
jgi:hypothetical protein